MAERAAWIDGTALVYRAWYALPRKLRTSRGLHTNAVFGFAQMFRKLLAGRTPGYGAVVFDAPGRKTFRDEAFPAYKAGRPRMPEALVAQLPWIEALVAAHDYPILRIEGVEADDVIATLTHRARARGLEVWIVSGDKDFAQLVGEGVRLFDPTEEVLYDADTVRRKWGVTPDRFADFLALVGDKVDGIPGVPGVGPKTAARWLNEHGDLRGVLSGVRKGKAAESLARHADQVWLARELATARVDVELGVALEDLALPEPSSEKINAIYRELEFFSLLSAEAEAPETPDGMRFFVVDADEVVAEALARECGGGEPVALRCLVELPSPLKGALVGVALSPRPGFALYFPLDGPGKVLGESGWAALSAWLSREDRPKVCHDAKGERVALWRRGVELRGVVFDTALASFLVDPSGEVPHRLEQVARAYLHRALQPLRGVIGRGQQTQRFAALTVDRAGAWACHLAEAVRSLWPVLLRQLREAGQRRNLEEVDLPLSAVLARMELHGVPVDPEPLRRFEAELEAERRGLEAQMAALLGHPFRPGSLRQLGEVLFEELGLPVIKRTRTGYSTDAAVLQRLADRHPLVPMVIRWRRLAKLVQTYTRALQAAIGEDGRIHSTIQQTVSVTGRLITTDPDLQRTPVRTDELRRVRLAFRAGDGWVWVRADWSQMELRVLAHLSGDPRLIEAFVRGEDVHRRTASELFGGEPAEQSAAQREIGKTVNFATLYGQGASALAEQLGVHRSEATRHIERFFEVYAGVAQWRERTLTAAYTDGFVTTWLGRRRQIPELTSNRPSERAYGERIAVNTPVQGSAADLCKLAMIEVDRMIEAEGLAARLVMTVHDELGFEVPLTEVEPLTAAVRRIMTSVGPLTVPLEVDIGVGPSWGAAKG